MLEIFVRLVTLWFRSHTSNIRLTELLYISVEAELEISVADKFQYFFLTEVASKNVIMIILENIYVEITSRWYIDSVIKIEKTIGHL